jgi:hypothetical protein
MDIRGRQGMNFSGPARLQMTEHRSPHASSR